jgi:hypothetical protein
MDREMVRLTQSKIPPSRPRYQVVLRLRVSNLNHCVLVGAGPASGRSCLLKCSRRRRATL